MNWLTKIRFIGDLKKRWAGQDLNKVSIKTYFKATPGKGDRIAVLVGEGDIVRGDPQEGSAKTPPTFPRVDLRKGDSPGAQRFVD